LLNAGAVTELNRECVDAWQGRMLYFPFLEGEESHPDILALQDSKKKPLDIGRDRTYRADGIALERRVFIHGMCLCIVA